MDIMNEFLQLNKNNFKFKLYNLPELNLANIDGKRFYETPDGLHYKSVTTFLSDNRSEKEKEKLQQWRDKVGDNEANKILKDASGRGNLVHEHLEDFLLNKPNQGSEFNYILNYFKPHLRRNLTIVHGIEVCLYSDILKLAGRCDLIGIWDNELSIIDFKTSLKPKKEEWIENYFLQTTIYSLMLQERLNKVAKRLVILIGIEGENKIQVFIKDRNEYIDKLYTIFKNQAK